MIYLDSNSTTKIDPRVLDKMMTFLTEQYGNAASNHAFGVSINQHVKEARNEVAELIGCNRNEIIFTSGATESINLAIKGVANRYQDKGKHIVTVCTEHLAVLDTCRHLETKGFEVTYLPVQSDGIIDNDILNDSLRDDTILVSVMMVNNETGVIQNIKKISDLAHEKGILFMTDATQAVGKIPVNVNELGIDLMAFSGHKYHGPKGIGGLYIRSRRPNKVKLTPLIHGGGHERGFRSGTLNVPGIVGLGEASRLARLEMSDRILMIKEQRDNLEKELLKIDGTFVNGNIVQRIHNTTNICFQGVDGDALIAELEDVMVSNGSACTSTKVEPSHVLIGMGLSINNAYSSLRFSLNESRKDMLDQIPILLTEAISTLKLLPT